MFLLFPYTVLSDKEYRHLSLLLPRLSVLQILRPVAAPDWLSAMELGWPAIPDRERIETVRLALKGFQEFASVHGDSSALASLSLDQISRAFAESRLHIQTELKGKDAAAGQEHENLLIEAAVFLEMARDLDEKEMEVEAGLAGTGHLEKQFREILGIADDEVLEDTLETLTPPLRTSSTELSYMLPKRIESWLRLLSNHPPSACPVLVTTEAGLEAFFDWSQAKGKAAGSLPEPTPLPLASIPALDDLGTEEFRGLVSDPKASSMLAAYWRELENTISSSGAPTRCEALAQTAASLQDILGQYRPRGGQSREGRVDLALVVADGLSWNFIWKQFGHLERPASLDGGVVPDTPIEILIWRS